MAHTELPESVNKTLLAGLNEELKSGKSPEEILEVLLSPNLDEQLVASMATWDYWVAQRVSARDKRFTKEKLESLNKRISSVLDE